MGQAKGRRRWSCPAWRVDAVASEEARTPPPPTTALAAARPRWPRRGSGAAPSSGRGRRAPPPTGRAESGRWRACQSRRHGRQPWGNVAGDVAGNAAHAARSSGHAPWVPVFGSVPRRCRGGRGTDAPAVLCELATSGPPHRSLRAVAWHSPRHLGRRPLGASWIRRVHRSWQQPFCWRQLTAAPRSPSGRRLKLG